MKTRKINKVITYTFIIITISLVFYYISSFDDDESINCTSAFSIVNDGEEYSFSVTFFASDGDGLITFTGNSRNTKDDISIRKYITYVKNKNNIYIFRSSDTNIRSNSTALPDKFDEILPPFFTGIRKEDRFIIKILKIKHDSWVFMSTNTPYFICENTNS